MSGQPDELGSTRTGLRTEKVVVQALEHAGLAQSQETAVGPPPAQRRRASVRKAVAGLGVLGAVAAGGGIAIQTSAPPHRGAARARPPQPTPPRPGDPRAPPAPPAGGWGDGPPVAFPPLAPAL